jgi:hypothetical protein
MVGLDGLLEEIGNKVENKVLLELSGLLGIIKAVFYNMLMPLVLNVKTERESHHFIFQTGGSVSLYKGLHNNADVEISGEHEEILYLLKTRDKDRFVTDEQTGKITVVSHTRKGRQAVMILRAMFL